MMSDFQDVMKDLTPEERNALKKATVTDWIESTQELATDPNFWGEIVNSFIEGFIRGLNNHR